MTPKCPASPERYHEKNHYERDRGPESFEECRRCRWAQAHCRSKRRFDSREAAEDAVRALNEREGYASPVVRYRCRWCPGWHLTTARTKVRAKRAERQRRKWIISARSDLGALACAGVARLPKEDRDG